MPPKLKEGYTPIKRLGSGGEGEAWLAYQSKSRTNVVIKVRHTRETPKEISNEVNLSLGFMKTLPQCPNLCAVFDYELTSAQASIMIEYCDGGDLRHVLNDTKSLGSIPKSFVSHVMVHLGAALIWLHTGYGYHLNSGYGDDCFEKLGGTKSWNPIYHRDIKPDNILVRMSGKFDRKTPYPDIVLADFGFGATKYSYPSLWKGKERIEAPRFKHFTDRSYGPPEYSDNNGDDYRHLSARSLVRYMATRRSAV
jgi:serine/threonine protein kinase